MDNDVYIAGTFSPNNTNTAQWVAKITNSGSTILTFDNFASDLSLIGDLLKGATSTCNTAILSVQSPPPPPCECYKFVNSGTTAQNIRYVDCNGDNKKINSAIINTYNNITTN